MRILVTNDDGVDAAQLVPLILWCRKLGEVTAVVPKYEQSAKSHSIQLRDAFEVTVRELASGVEALVVDSSPADCVRYAVLGLKQHFDLVISGVNRGFNVGTDILYSGTVAAISEAGILGLPGIALSTDPAGYHEATLQLDRVWDFISANRLLERHSLYNINIPPSAEEIRITRQGGAFYSDDFLPIGNDRYQPTGKCVYRDNGDNTLDTNAVMNGCISVMPLTICRTDMDIYRALI